MSKIMTVLYYTNSNDARHDCELLGIDKRRVKNLVRGYNKNRYSEETGHWDNVFENGEIVKKNPITTILKVNSTLLTDEKLHQMKHVDDESYW